MTPVKPQIKNISDREVKWTSTCYGGSSHELLLSESSRSYMLALLMYAIFSRSKLPQDYLD
jgi:hypothetical protein